LVEQLVDGSTVTANALRVDVNDAASGVAPGTQVVLGHLEASAGDPIPDSPSPDPGSAPSDPGTAAPADGANSPVPSTAPGRPLPVATTPVVPTTVVPSTVTPGSGLGLPRQVAPSVSAVPTSQGYVFPVTGGTSSDFSDDYGGARADTGWHHGTGFLQWTGSNAQRQALERIHEFSGVLHKTAALARHDPACRDLEEARWRLLRAQTSCNLFWGENWVHRIHDDLNDAHPFLEALKQNAPPPAPPPRPMSNWHPPR
jgi:hypothetical protein